MNKSYFFDRFVMRRNYRELMISLGEGDKKIKELADFSGMAYQHLCSVLQEAQKEGIITSKKKDNSLNFNLTFKGNAIKELCIGLKMCIEDWDEEKTIEKLFLKLDNAKAPKGDVDPEKSKGASKVITQPTTPGGNKDGKQTGPGPGK